MKEFLNSLVFRSSKSINFRSMPFRELPVELYRLIFEYAASDRNTALSLCRVSQEVRLWISPFVYHTVILPSPERLVLFQRTITMNYNTNRNLALHVRNLFLRSMSIPSDWLAVNVLGLCPNIQRLVVDALHRQPVVDESIPWPTPSEVVYIYGATSWLERGHPSLQNVTHLHLDGVIFTSTIDSCLALPRLSHLGITHVHVASNNHVYDENFVRLINRALTSRSSLEMVLVQLKPIFISVISGELSGSRIWENLAKLQDERLFARIAIEPEDFLRALELGTSIWDNASTSFADWRTYPSSMSSISGH